MKDIKKDIKIGQRFRLKTLDEEGFYNDPALWIDVVWDGTSLVDPDGDHWTEWLTQYAEDIETF